MNFTKQYSMYLIDTTAKAKEQLSCLSFDWDVYCLYELLSRILQALDLEVILILLDLLVTFYYLIQGSNIHQFQPSGLFAKKTPNEMMWGMVHCIILLLKRRLLQHIRSVVQAKEPRKDNSSDGPFFPLSAYF